MLDKAALFAARHRELCERTADGSVLTDPAALTALMKELRRLTPITEAYERHQSLSAALAEARALAASPDRELALMADEEIATILPQLAALEDEIKILLLPRDENDDKNVIVEIRAGAGGEEAALFAADLYRMYTMYAEGVGLKTSRLSENETELGGYREITFMIEGEGAYSRFKFESGVHRVQRVPATESQGRIQTSTVTVAVLPEAEEIDVEINPADVVMEACKSSGAGGQQKVNTSPIFKSAYHSAASAASSGTVSINTRDLTGISLISYSLTSVWSHFSMDEDRTIRICLPRMVTVPSASFLDVMVNTTPNKQIAMKM